MPASEVPPARADFPVVLEPSTAQTPQQARVKFEPWHDDELLPGYKSRDMALVGVFRHPEEVDPAVGDDSLVATLVRRNKPRHERAVLYIHGWNDYFFHTHVADLWDGLGYDFYAIDLRRYGRSLRTGMMGGYIENLADYDLELDAAINQLRKHHDSVVLYGHSTGGLVAALWAQRHPGALRGIVLNSPWIELHGSSVIRTLLPALVRGVATHTATLALPNPDTGFYARSLAILNDGTWSYDLELKRSPSPPGRSGWLDAVMAGHVKVAAGLGIDIPILMATSTKSDFRRRWSDELTGVDIILDVSRLAAQAHCLGRHVTLVRIEGAIHDIALSRRDVRERFADEIRRWESAYLR